MMLTIIAGSREYSLTDKDYELLNTHTISTVICGGARGVDTCGKIWAEKNNIPVIMMKANWKDFGKSAGYYRNCQMADIAKALIVFWDGESKGTKHMINIARKRGLKITMYRRG